MAKRSQAEFDAVCTRLHYVLCQLSCASQVLDISDHVEKDEQGARACEVIRHGVAELSEIRDALDGVMVSAS